MTPDDMIPDDFDQRIRAALDATPTPEQDSQLARLEQFWRDRSRAERRRRRSMQAAALAASVFVVAAAWFALNSTPQPAPQGDVLAEAPRPVEIPLAPASEGAATQPDGPRTAALPSSGREPTAYERLVFAARTTAPIDPEQALLARLRRPASVDETHTLVRRLGEIGTPRSIAALLAAAEHHGVRLQAMAAVEKILGVDRLAEVVPQTRSAAVRAELLARLLAAGSDAAVGGFLAMVADPASRREAITAASAAEVLPLDPLVRSLDGPRKEDRLAAAIVLGHINSPAVSEALIARVSQADRASVETWVALLARRDEPVERFLAQAARRPRLLGQVNNARAFWARMMP